MRRGLDDRGAAPAEFVLVGSLLTLLTMVVLQIGVVIYVRNVMHDAAVEAAYHAALADTSLGEGEAKAWQVLSATIGTGLVSSITASVDSSLGYPAVRVSIDAAVPLLGFLGPPHTMEVTGHAPVESLDAR